MNIVLLGALVVTSVIFLAPSSGSAGECLDYEPAMVTIQGGLSLKLAYGPPGFGEDPRHDAREDYLALTLGTPVCLTASGKPLTDDVAETDITTMQLVFDNGEAFRRAKHWIGQQISVTGSLYHQFSGHHHATILMKVRETGQAVTPGSTSR